MPWYIAAIETYKEAPVTELVTMAEVLGRYRISRETLRRWIAEGRIPKPVKLGRRVLFRSVDLLRREDEIAAVC
jgi:excisionase family DNA binding protein